MQAKNNRAAIMSIGEELLLGQIVDTNASWLCGQLAARGWKVSTIRTVGDDFDAIIESIRVLTENNGVLILTGGLGPTDDDLTREAMARAAGVPSEENAELLEQVKERFRQIDRPMTPGNVVQARIPKGAMGIFNALGTAPGVDFVINGCRCFAMPGVPVEMRGMSESYVFPEIGQGASGVVFVRELKLWGKGESSIGEELSDLMRRGRNPNVGTRVRDSIISVRIVAEAADRKEAERLATEDADEIRRRMGAVVFGEGDDTLATAVINELKKKGEKVALAESCTGGMVGMQITDIPGSSAVFERGFITYANAAKVELLGVSEELLARKGAVDAEVAKCMAEGAARAARTAYGIGITGIAGPDGGSAEKPVGLVYVAVHGPNGTEVRENRFSTTRECNRTRAAYTALGMLYRMLIE